MFPNHAFYCESHGIFLKAPVPEIKRLHDWPGGGHLRTSAYINYKLNLDERVVILGDEISEETPLRRNRAFQIYITYFTLEYLSHIIWLIIPSQFQIFHSAHTGDKAMSQPSPKATSVADKWKLPLPESAHLAIRDCTSNHPAPASHCTHPMADRMLFTAVSYSQSAVPWEGNYYHGECAVEGGKGYISVQPSKW